MFGLGSARSRAITAGLVLVLLLASFAAVALRRTADHHKRLSELEEVSVAASALEHARAEFYLESAALAALILSQDPRYLDDYHAARQALDADLAWAEAEALAGGEADELAMLRDLIEQRAQFEDAAEQGIPLLLAMDPATATQLGGSYTSEWWAETKAIIADLEWLAANEQNELAGDTAAADQDAAATFWLFIGFGAVGLMVTAGTVGWLVLSVVRPLASLRTSARAIAAGDSDVRAEVSGPEEIVSLARDFNEMTDALAAKTEEYIATTNLTGDIIVRLDKNGRCTFVNDATCQFFGKPREQVLGAKLGDYLHPDDAASASQGIRDMIERKELVRGFVNRWLTPAGVRVVEWNGYPLFDEAGQYAGFQATGRDISERKQMEDALAAKTEEYIATTNLTGDIIVRLDKDGRFTFVNDAACQTFGKPREELLGTAAEAFMDPDDLERTAQAVSEMIESKGLIRGFEGRLVTPIGTRVFEWNGYLLFDEQDQYAGIQITARDVTERNQMEQTLRDSEARYRLLAENASDVIWTMDLSLRYTYISPSITRMRGYSVEEVTAQTVNESMTPASREVAVKTLAEELAIEKLEHKDLSRSRTLELEMNCKDGSTLWCEMKMTFLRDSGGQPVGIQGVTRDISERKKAEERLRILFEFAPDGYYLHDLQGNFVDGNRAAEELIGYKREEVIGRNLLEVGLLPPAEVPTVAATLAKSVQGLPTGPDEFTLIRKDGSQIAVEIRTFPVQLGEETLVLGSARDISERKKAEEERERLHAELETRAITDSLTGLYNHAHFYERLASEIDRSKRYDHRFALVMMDVDAFKHYNDSRGHQAGDEALRLVGDCIRSAMRRSDLAFRYGGDEFVAILLNADASRSRVVVNRINRLIAARLEETGDHAGAWLGVSAGVACFPDDATTVGELIRMADAAMYDAKRLAWARGAMVQGQAIGSLAFPPGALHETQTRMLSTAASSLAAALHDLTAPEIVAELDLRTIAAVGAAAEIKDPYIRGHQERVSRWAAALAEEMGLPPEEVRHIRIAGLLHDLGKVSVGERILNKPGKLSEEEFARIKEHTALGAMMIISEAEALRQLAPIVRHHHERFDGKGYPDGLAGEDIPLEARIMSVADVFDAMTHERSYRKALSTEEAIAELKRGAGTQFDPRVVEAFLALAKRRGKELAAFAHAASEDRQLATQRAPRGTDASGWQEAPGPPASRASSTAPPAHSPTPPHRLGKVPGPTSRPIRSSQARS